MLLLLGFAFVAGLVTILSPCILPVLPIVLSGSLSGGKKRPFGIIVGFILSFTFFTVFSFALLRAFGISSEVLRIVAAVVLALFGISLFIPQIQVLLEKLVSGVSQSGPDTQKEGFSGGVVIGLSLGLFWTPCVGPILASVITLAATSAVTLNAVLITLAYALGTAIPMFFITYGGRKLLQSVPWLTRNTAKIQKVFGVIMVLLAMALYFGLDRSFQKFILDTFPQYGSGLTKFEENSAIQDSLQNLQGNSNTSSQNTAPEGEDLGTENAPLAPNPEFSGATKWLNSEPLTLEKLQGKVVLVDFWTYSCINCIRTLPYVTSWYEKYKDQGFVVIGVHAPEFEFEQNEQNVLAAMKDYGITYPVVQDNDFAIWQSYQNHFWPAEYFIDKNGKLRRTHFGEGKYDESEKFIQTLLKETGAQVTAGITPVQSAIPSYEQTPESYLGYARLDRFASAEKIVPDTLTKYSISSEVPLHALGYTGSWNVGEQRALPEKDATLELNFFAQDVYFVMRPRPTSPGQIRLLLDSKPLPEKYFGAQVTTGGIVTIDHDDLYRLVHLTAPEKHILSIQFLDANTEAYVFTFG